MFTYEYAEPTDQMLLTEILDLDTGIPIEPRTFLSRDLAVVMQDRNEMAGRYARNPQQPWLVCQLCGGAVMLVRTKDRRFHFRHHTDEEGTLGCPISTRGEFSADQINKMKYNAAKESLAHLRLKGIIRDSLIADSTCSEPQVEKVWRGMPVAERATWRKPDVQVEREGQRLAFEVQLSTTFLTEIVGRREFYRANGGAIIWVFEGFDPAQTRTAEEDIFYLNNLNAFVVNDDTLRRSIDAKRMALDCWYAIPRRKGKMIANEWVMEKVFLDQLTIDPDRQLVYFHDYQSYRARLEEELDVNNLRQAFHDFWIKYGASDTPDAKVAWTSICNRMKEVLPDVRLPESYFWEDPFHGVVSIILSARYGRPIGYRLQRLIEVTNVVFNAYKAYLLPFGWTLDAFDHNAALQEQDRKGTWAKRRKQIRHGIESRDEAYRWDQQYDRLFAFLVPEISEKLARVREW
jgi:hypothetical protein